MITSPGYIGNGIASLIPSLIRPINTSALAADVDLTVDPADATKETGSAIGIYSVAGGNVALLMAGSDTPSTITLAAGGSRFVRIRKILMTGTTAASVEVAW